MSRKIFLLTLICLLFPNIIYTQYADRKMHRPDSLYDILPHHKFERSYLQNRIHGEDALPESLKSRALNDDPFIPPHLRERDSRLNQDIDNTLQPDNGQLDQYRKRPWEKHENNNIQLGVLSDTLSPAWVTHYASGLAPSSDFANAIAVDNDGNVYIAGNSDSTFTGTDYIIIKYNSSGEVLWERRYNGPGNGNDVANAITLDGQGNVYVTGSSYGWTFDYATIKYSSSGVQQWVSRYYGPGVSDDYATAIAVDGDVNVYVTGYSVASGTSYDYATIKYNNSGVQQWVARYNGPGNNLDQATTLAVDASGNVYVTGTSYGSGTYGDYATIKYNNSGVQQWVARYNGPGNNLDQATALAVDASGNVYVTGTSYGSGTSYDYATIKYNSSGDQQWVTRYNGPGNSGDGATALSVDASGNVYVTGDNCDSSPFSDYATIKYNSSGAQQWVARYNGPDNSWDQATSLSIDGSGNVYVTGRSVGSGTNDDDYATIKYNSSGVQQWVSRYNGPGNSLDRATALSIDASGNVYVTGNSYGSGTYYDNSTITIKYNSSGVQQWVARYNGPGNSSDYATALSVDASGNVYVTGYSYGSGTASDYATIKYNSSGVQQWVARYNGPGNSEDKATALTIDGSGNVYVTGRSVGSGTNDDYATIKYNSSGVQQWVSRYNGPGNSDDEATAIAVDGQGNVYITGYSQGTGTSDDYTTIKYNSSGVQQWGSRYDGPKNEYDRATAITVDGQGNVYITGYSQGSGTSDDYATIKYNSSGVQQWVSRYNNSELNLWERATAIALDIEGNVYVTGYSVGRYTSEDYVTIKYNTLGVQQWASRYDGSANSGDYATAIVVDEGGNVYVTGYSVGAGTYYDYATVKYNSSGVQQWVNRYDGPANSDVYAAAIAVDGQSNVYVAGYSYGLGMSDYATIKYNSYGLQKWVCRYDGPANSNDYATAIVVDGQYNVYVTGRSASDDWSILILPRLSGQQVKT
jgi:uncharacterized delta-60 repeat protein